jgi:hypothetical protein
MNLTSISNNTAAAYKELDDKVAALGANLSPAQLTGVQTALSKAKTGAELESTLVEQSSKANMNIIGKMV